MGGCPATCGVYELTEWGRGLEPIVVALGTWALAAPRTAEQVFVSADSAMLSIRTFFVPTPRSPEATLRIELRDHGPAGDPETVRRLVASVRVPAG